jgi:hypothetical protein
LHVLQINTIEVVLDENGVARRVAAGQGTHVIRTFPDKETKMERKAPVKPSEVSNLTRPQAAYYPKCQMMTSCFPSNKRVHPNNNIITKEQELEEKKKTVS